jgi:hypothetical protein
VAPQILPQQWAEKQVVREEVLEVVAHLTNWMLAAAEVVLLARSLGAS